MSKSKRVLVCEFHQESDTFNPLISTIENCFEKVRCAYGKDAYDKAKLVPCALHGMIDAVEEFGGELILSQSLWGGSGGRVADDAPSTALLTLFSSPCTVPAAPRARMMPPAHCCPTSANW